MGQRLLPISRYFILQYAFYTVYLEKLESEIAFHELYLFSQAQIEALEGLACDDQIISHCGIPLQDETLVCQSGIEEFNTLEVSSRLLGGKDQTPMTLLPSLTILF